MAHVFIIPNFQEPSELLGETLEALAAHPEAVRRYCVVLAMEAAEAGSAAKAQALEDKYAGRFWRMHHTVRLLGMYTEGVCSAAWAAGQHGQHGQLGQHA